jgi:hypothetical protein
LLDARAAAARPDDGEIAGSEVAGALRVEDDRNAGREVRLAGEQPPATADLDDERLAQSAVRSGGSGGS